MIQDGPGEPIFVLEPTETQGEQATIEGEATPAPTSMSKLLPGALLAFGVLILVMISIRMLKRNLARNAVRKEGTPRERIDQLRAQARAISPVDTYEAEAEELTRRLSAIMDNKAARLELLIEEADERLARLDRASLGSGVQTRPMEHDAGAFRASSPEPVRAAPAPERHVDPTQRQIYELADSGLGPVEIAQRLDQPIGQVELILNLRRRGA